MKYLKITAAFFVGVIAAFSFSYYEFSPYLENNNCFSDTRLAKTKQYWSEIGHESKCGVPFQQCLNDYELIPKAERYCPQVPTCEICYHVEYREPDCEITEQDIELAYVIGKEDGINECNALNKMYPLQCTKVDK